MKKLLRIGQSKKQSSQPEQLNHKLLKAICTTEPDIVKIEKLINKNANVNMKVTADNSLLHILANKNSIELIDLMIANGADINAQNNSKDTPTHIALKWKNFSILPALLSHNPKLDICNEYGNTALHTAVLTSDLDIMKSILKKKGLDIDHKNHQGITPLYLALRNARWDIGKLLIEKGADVKVTDLKHNTLLHMIMQYPANSDIVKLLIEKGVDVNAQNSNKDTALHLKIQDLNSFIQGTTMYIKKDFLDFLSLFENTEVNLGIQNQYNQSVLRFLCIEYKKLMDFSLTHSDKVTSTEGDVVAQDDNGALSTSGLLLFREKLIIFAKKALEYGEDIREYETLLPKLFLYIVSDRGTKSARKVAPTDAVSSDAAQPEIATLEEQFAEQNLDFSFATPAIPDNISDLSGAFEDF